MRNLELLYSQTVQLDVGDVNHINLSTEAAGTTFIASTDQLSTFDYNDS